MMRELARLRRRAVGRKSEPGLAIIDAQTLKCIPVRGRRGFDAVKRTVGRRRVALWTRTEAGRRSRLCPASVQERDTSPALDDGKAAWPSLRTAILDGAFTAERCREWSDRHSMREIVTREPG